MQSLLQPTLSIRLPSRSLKGFSVPDSTPISASSICRQDLSVMVLQAGGSVRRRRRGAQAERRSACTQRVRVLCPWIAAEATSPGKAEPELSAHFKFSMM